VTLEAELEQRQNAAVKTGVLASAMAPRVREVKETFLRPNKLRAATSSRSARTARGVRSAQGEAPLTRPRLRGARQWQLRLYVVLANAAARVRPARRMCWRCSSSGTTTRSRRTWLQGRERGREPVSGRLGRGSRAQRRTPGGLFAGRRKRATAPGLRGSTGGGGAH